MTELTSTLSSGRTPGERRACALRTHRGKYPLGSRERRLTAELSADSLLLGTASATGIATRPGTGVSGTELLASYRCWKKPSSALQMV